MPKTSTPQIKIVNAETGEEIVRDMNEAELAQLQTDKIAYDNAVAAAATKEASRQAILEHLGITEEQAKLLLS